MTDVDPRTMRTRAALIAATIETMRAHGVAHLSARTIARTAGVNQALVFYHFGSVSALVAEACLVATGERVDQVGGRLDAVRSFAELVDVARLVHDSEHAAGNVDVLAQVLTAAQSDPELAEAAGRALALWIERIEGAVDRLLSGSPFAEAIDAPSLAHLIASTFIGLELMGPAAPGHDPVTVLERLSPLARVLDDLGPLARRAVRSRLRER